MKGLYYYGAVALTCCPRLKNLFIGDYLDTSDPMAIHETEEWDRMAPHLPLFTTLKTLKNSKSSLESFDKFIEECPPSLQSLEVEILPRSSEADYADLQPLIYLRLLNAHYYMMHKYLSLDHLHINPHSRKNTDKLYFVSSRGNRRCIFSSDMITKFMSFVSKIRSHNIQLQVLLRVLHKAVTEHDDPSLVSKSHESKSRLFYQLPPTDGYRLLTLVLSKDLPNKNEIGVVYLSQDACAWPHLLLLQNSGRYIHSLSASTSSPVHLNASASPFELDHVLTHCINLHQLTIFKSTLSILETKTGIYNQSITDLKLQNVQLMAPAILGVISQKLLSWKNMVIDSCTCYKDAKMLPVERFNGSIGMSDTKFDSLYLKNTFFADDFFFNLLYLKVHRKDGDVNKSPITFHRFEQRIDSHTVAECLEEAFETRRQGTNFITYSVTTADVKKIKFEAKFFNCEIIF